MNSPSRCGTTGAERRPPRPLPALGLIAALALLGGAARANEAGRVQFVVGEVNLLQPDGSARPARKAELVNEGDTIVTSPNGAIQVRMIDGGLISVRPDSRLRVNEYRYSGKEDGSERGVLGLVKGGFRTLTGVIGRTNKANYRVETPNAAIGIRGTDHEPFFIPVPLPGEIAQGTPGTYNKVNVGETFIESNGVRIELGPNQVGFATTTPGVAPVRLQSVPGFLRATPVQQSSDERRATRASSASDQRATAVAASGGTTTSGATASGAASGSSGSGGSTPATSLSSTTTVTASQVQYVQETAGGGINLTQAGATTTTTLAAQDTVLVGGDRSGSLISSGGLLVVPGGGTVYLGADGNPSNFTSADGFSYTRGNATLADSGSTTINDAGTTVTVRWGVYAGGSIIESNSSTRTADYFHFLSAPGMPAAAIAGLNATYTVPVAHTKFITETGALGGTLDMVSIQFTSGFLVNYGIGITDAAGRSWLGTYAGSATALQFVNNGVPLTGFGPGGMSTGNARGYPIGPNGAAVASSFDMKDSLGAAVTGSFVAKQ